MFYFSQLFVKYDLHGLLRSWFFRLSILPFLSLRTVWSCKQVCFKSLTICKHEAADIWWCRIQHFYSVFQKWGWQDHVNVQSSPSLLLLLSSASIIFCVHSLHVTTLEPEGTMGDIIWVFRGQGTSTMKWKLIYFTSNKFVASTFHIIRIVSVVVSHHLSIMVWTHQMTNFMSQYFWCKHVKSPILI